MPHPNALKQLEKYGPIATQLERLTNEVDSRYGEGAYTEDATKDFAAYCSTHEIKPTLEALLGDKYAYNRELVAVTILYLWQSYKNNISDGTYDERLDIYCEVSRKLTWTMPILETLIGDKAVGPIELAVSALSEMRDAAPEIHEQAESMAAQAYKSHSKSVRLEAIRALPSLVQMNDDADWIASDLVIDTLIKGTKDKYEDVRNWAYYGLCSNVDNPSSRVAEAFKSGIKKEKYDSEASLEALAGLAKYDGRLTDEIVCKRLKTFDCTALWLEAAEQSHSTECLEALIELYEATRAEDDQEGINEYWYKKLEDILFLWNM